MLYSALVSKSAFRKLFTCRMLQLSMSNHLDLAHLTWCSALDTQADFMMYMLISPVVVLRYGTYVDIAAPLFSWSFLQQIVLPTLVEAQSGTNTICSMHAACAVAICLWRVGMSTVL